jgi:integrase/recombinase XerD
MVNTMKNQTEIKRRQGQSRVLKSTEIKRVIEYQTGRKNGSRNTSVILLGLYSGLRVSELSSLKNDDLMNNDWTIKEDVVLRKENTKTNKSRKFFITNKKLKECLENYKNEKRQKYQIAESSFKEVKSESFFQNQKGGGFNKITLQHLIKKMFRDVGLDEMCSSHSLRRTFITNLFQSGINTKIVSQLSGHSNVQTTMNYYYQETDEVLKDVVGEIVIR